MTLSDIPDLAYSHHGMRSEGYWKEHYVTETNANEIERKIRRTAFVSDGNTFELIYFEKAKDAPNILVSQGSGGHAYVFAELHTSCIFMVTTSS